MGGSCPQLTLSGETQNRLNLKLFLAKSPAIFAGMNTTTHTTEPDCLAYSAAELAKQLHCSARHIAALNASGRIPAPIRLGRCTRWLRSEIVEWLAASAPCRDKWEALKAGGRR